MIYGPGYWFIRYRFHELDRWTVRINLFNDLWSAHQEFQKEIRWNDRRTIQIIRVDEDALEIMGRKFPKISVHSEHKPVPR